MFIREIKWNHEIYAQYSTLCRDESGDFQWLLLSKQNEKKLSVTTNRRLVEIKMSLVWFALEMVLCNILFSDCRLKYTPGWFTRTSKSQISSNLFAGPASSHIHSDGCVVTVGNLLIKVNSRPTPKTCHIFDNEILSLTPCLYRSYLSHFIASIMQRAVVVCKRASVLNGRWILDDQLFSGLIVVYFRMKHQIRFQLIK